MQVNNGVVNIGVDTQSIVPVGGPGRQAVRIVSNTAYNHGDYRPPAIEVAAIFVRSMIADQAPGLFIGDFSHMPGVCGTWPAFWMVGPNWPAGGEMGTLFRPSMHCSILTSGRHHRGRQQRR